MLYYVVLQKNQWMSEWANICIYLFIIDEWKSVRNEMKGREYTLKEREREQNIWRFGCRCLLYTLDGPGRKGFYSSPFSSLLFPFAFFALHHLGPHFLSLSLSLSLIYTIHSFLTFPSILLFLSLLHTQIFSSFLLHKQKTDKVKKPEQKEVDKYMQM